jgi:dipeptidyl aminopeptidase/acylaminoacyl peptidase
MPNLRLFLSLFAVACGPIPASRAAETLPAAVPVKADSATKSLITAADLINIKQLESPALSPDGKWLVYVVRSIEAKPDSAKASDGAKDDWVYRTQLWLAATDGKTPPRQLTFGPARNSAPVWSPTGDRLAFVRSVEKEKPQIHVLFLAGGEAQPLTKLETGAGEPRWSPDGTKILFTSSLSYGEVRAALEKAGQAATPPWANERPGRKPNDTDVWIGKDDKHPEAKPDGSLQEIREWLAKNEADGNPRVMNRLNFLGEGDLSTETDFTEFYTVDAQGGEPKAVTLGYEGYANPEWLADGKSLVCLGPRKPTIHTDRDRFDSLYLIDVASGKARVLLEEAGVNYGPPQPSPDGKWIAFAETGGGEFSFEQAVVAVMPSAGGTSVNLTPDLDRSASDLTWSPDSKFIYFTAPDHGRFPLFRVAANKPGAEKLTAQNDWGIRDFAIGANVLAQVVTNPGDPWEIYTGPVDGKTSGAITTHNSSWIKERQLSAYEPHRLVQADGVTVDYWTIKPANFDPAKKYPLLVQIHGGPTAMWGPGEQTMWHEFQFYAARGYVIVFANPRGSGGYGKDFQHANFKDWGTGPASDVLAAASFVAKESYVDKDRQVLTGGSYGGYLTAWIVGHDNRFKAAVAQRGVYDLSIFYGEGNAWFLLPLYWGGYPWEKDVRAILDRDSPLSYVDSIKTPLLIQHGDVDFRTGFVQSQILYKSLKQLGRDVEYVRYPRATHELSRSGEPKQRLDTLVRYEEFFRRYIGEN